MELFPELLGCERCPLHKTRTNIVFGSGNPKAEIVLVGEAPGRDEDLSGIPFVGQSGKLLDALLGRAGIPRGSVYVANVLKCRPPGNRDPDPDEVRACFPFLERQIAEIGPKVVVALGRHAACRLSLRWAPMGVLADADDLKFGGIPVFALWHPSFLLRHGRERTPEAKRLFGRFVEKLKAAKAACDGSR